MPSKVAISGLTGFVGENLSKYLTHSDIEWTKIDRHNINNKDIKFDGITSIVHLAGKAHDLANVSNPDDYYNSNYELTKKLFDSFMKSDATEFIFISSVKATADFVDDVLYEDHFAKPTTHYGKSKLMAEQYILSQDLPKEKFVYVLRPCMIHGPGNKGNLNLLYKFVQKGIPYPLASFENQRSFLSVENLCFVIREILTRHNVPSGIYNVADDEALSTNDLVSTLSAAIGKKTRLLFVPQKVIQFAARIGDKLGLPLNSDRLNKLTENYVVSNRKIKTTLGIELPIKAKEGLIITVHSFK